MAPPNKEFDAVADAHRQISELRLQMHDSERARSGGEDERFGRMLSGAVREMHDKAQKDREEGDAKRHEELLAHLHAISERHADGMERMIASHQGLIDALHAHTEALNAHTAARDGEVEVHKSGTVQTPQGEHHMNVVEIHRRRKA